ncbi:putative bifunctional diguanylate cyclase/phosphodiesterase [Natronoglycomyces albus]|uniref:Bifunctional diguanylate cyclase/phosphodiesterase n=1 Tax=Natronoglycomyces albus TaxID=2811108 RepID=A0A895XTB5_9ACTN|nr:bifunctional diguanylate cyclase/phosphodiesterase [Natronoglycomyces albus]QSB06549.1 bifunctional diguanylate cyclase/phosphodiesterase [Natronoglycomyces albus]
MATTLVRNTAPREHPGRYYAFLAAIISAAIIAVATTIVIAPLSFYDNLVAVPPAFWVVAVLALAVEMRSIRWRGISLSTSPLFSAACFLAVMVTWGFLPALIVQAGVAILASVKVRAALWRAGFNVAQMALALSVSWWVWTALTEGNAWETTGYDVLALVLAGCTWSIVSHLCVAGALKFRAAMGVRDYVMAYLRTEAFLGLALIALAPIIATAAVTSAWLVVAAAVPLLSLYRLLNMAAEREHQANLDPLTGMLNRKGFEIEVGDKIVNARETDTKLSLLVLDLVRFAEVNSALGHAVGDQLLEELAQRFNSKKSPGKLMARLGGDEFAFVWAELDGMDDPASCVMEIRSCLDQPVSLGDVAVNITGAIGSASFPEDGEDFESLFRRAHIALGESKRRGSDYTRYAEEFDHHSPERLMLLGDLRRALDDPRLPGVKLFYQPQMCLDTGQVLGVEALLRYTHPTQGNIQPTEILALAEQSAVMRLLTERVVEIALSQQQRWISEGHNLRVAVNVSVRDLESADFVDFLTERMRLHHVPARLLQLEITESALMADPRRVVDNVTRLAELGVGLSLDDFGTGFSSMQHLRRLPVSEIKIDRQFVAGLIDDPDDAAIVSSTIDLGRALDLLVVAEGVEEEATRAKLEEWGCHAAQGWLYARPMSAAKLDGWLRSREAAEAVILDVVPPS